MCCGNKPSKNRNFQNFGKKWKIQGKTLGKIFRKSRFSKFWKNVKNLRESLEGEKLILSKMGSGKCSYYVFPTVEGYVPRFWLQRAAFWAHFQYGGFVGRGAEVKETHKTCVVEQKSLCLLKTNSWILDINIWPAPLASLASLAFWKFGKLQNLKLLNVSKIRLLEKMKTIRNYVFSGFRTILLPPSNS